MQFNINIWRKNYDKVRSLGQMVKDSMPDWQGRPPLSPLSKEQKSSLKREIKVLIAKNSTYLDKSGIKMPAPLWIYNPSDLRTCASSESFAYKHLLNP